MNIKNVLFSAAITFFAALPVFSQVVINEVFLSGFNGSEAADHGFKVDDWIELYNSSNSNVNLTGWYLSDSKDEPTKWRIPSGTINSNDHRVFNANGLDNTNKNTNFKIDQSELNEEVVLTDPTGKIVDVYNISAYTQIGHSRGRTANGANTWAVFENPTKNANNNANAATNYAPNPIINIPAGAYANSVTISIIVPTGFTARYEINTGNNNSAKIEEPSSSSSIYTSPLTFNSTTVLKVRLFDDSGQLLPSFIETNTYLINENHTIYTLSVSGKNNIISLLEGDSTLYPLAHWEFFDETGTLVSEVAGNLNKHGQDSWAYPQRGFDIFARDEAGYGGLMKHKFYEDKNREVFDRFIIRAAGDDNYPYENGGAHIRDAFVQTWGFRSNIEMDHRTYRPCVVYINGKYWGVYEIREKVVHKEYTKHYYGQAKDDLDFISYWGERTIRYGSANDWDALINFIDNNNMSSTSNFNYVNDRVNLTSWTDYVLFNNYIVSKDWNNYNSAWWRGRNPEGGAKKWQFILWDMDASFGHYINYSDVPDTSPNASPCDVLDNSPIDDPEDLLSSFEKLIDQNTDFRNFVANRYNDLLNTYWNCNYSIPLLNEMVAEKEIEMPRQISRWNPNLYYNTDNNGTVNQWEDHVQDIRDFLNDRCDVIDNRLASCLSLGTKYQVTIQTEPSNLDCAGIRTNSIDLPVLPTTGAYYKNLPIDVIANNSFNYQFSYWTTSNGTSISNIYADSIRVNFRRNETLTAHFLYVGDGKELVINEIHYNPIDSILANGDTISGKSFEFVELKNTGTNPVDLKGLYFGKGIGETFKSSNVIAPDSFVVLAEDSAMFHAKYGFAADYKFNGKLENNGEKIWLNDVCGNIIDSLRYDDNLPWDTLPDNSRYSLALIDALADNANPANWAAQSVYTTPGAENSFCTTITNTNTVAPLTCYGANDGFISATTTGGKQPYSYSWNNGINNAVITGLAPGTYVLTITDAFNCQITDSIQIIEPPLLQPTVVTNIESYYEANDGEIDLTVTGGVPPYSYTWSNAATTEDISNLEAGTFSVIVADANNCESTLNNIQLNTNCPVNLVQTSQLFVVSNIYHVALYIKSSGTVNINDTVSFYAGDYIELTNDFEVKKGAEFYADIDGCN